MYLEVIIIHLFKMDNNTLIHIDKRGKKKKNDIEFLINNEDLLEEYNQQYIN